MNRRAVTRSAVRTSWVSYSWAITSDRRATLCQPMAGSVLEPLFDQALRTVPLDRPVARRAAEMPTQHYHRPKRPISLADAILLASAAADDTIATADPDVLAIAALEGIPTIELPGED